MNHCVLWAQSNNHQRQKESFHNFKQAGSCVCSALLGVSLAFILHDEIIEFIRPAGIS